jgi:hypothetical protein
LEKKKRMKLRNCFFKKEAPSQVAVIQATWEAEARGSFEPRSLTRNMA